jgi:hypothetical protein
MQDARTHVTPRILVVSISKKKRYTQATVPHLFLVFFFGPSIRALCGPSNGPSSFPM